MKSPSRALINFCASILLPLLFSCSTPKKAQQLWSPVDATDSQYTGNATIPDAYDVYRLQVTQITDALRTAGTTRDEARVVELPGPTGPMRFVIWKSGVVSAELAAKFPSLVAYEGVATDSDVIKLRMETPQAGLQVMVMERSEQWFISPFDPENDIYMVYKKSDLTVPNTFWEGKNE